MPSSTGTSTTGWTDGYLAKQWFELFNATVRALGGVADVMQPTLFKLKDLVISVHVDDLLLLGSKTAMNNFIDYLKTKAGWKMDIEGPFKNIDEFMYLKRKYSITQDGIIVRPDPRRIEELTEMWSWGEEAKGNSLRNRHQQRASW